ncbi:hypothetical protein ABIA39_007431 [Nocardia sp. GAS34]|uniref:hypothetical protein n=1 Tax=unclassified Nocardia TaxID=2637762 RepID=UPI003D24AFDD
MGRICAVEVAVSEYQYYEFVAVDRPLDERAQAQVRALSTRARVTSTTFVNEYHWGNFRGVPDRMVEQYYDAHLYLANWGSRRVMLRLPKRVLDLDMVEQYCLDEHMAAWTSGEHLVVDMASEDDEAEWDRDPESWLPAILGVRAELAAGDLRPLYLAWLAGYGSWEREEWAFDRDHDDEPEPAVPPGLGELTAAQRALADFLRLDDDLLTVAATASPPLRPAADDPQALAAWIADLPAAEKNQLLARVVAGDAAVVGMELLRRFRGPRVDQRAEPDARTVADLLDGAARHRAERENREEAAREAERARHSAEQARRRERRLDELDQDEETAWERVETLIATVKPREYDAAVAILTDLHAVAERSGRQQAFGQRVVALHNRHSRKHAFIARLAASGLSLRS